MEACSRWVRIGFFAVLTVGFLWRVTRYALSFPIWGDEAMLLLNIHERDYAGLTHLLKFAQVAPLFFLWLEKLATDLLGPAEWSVHLFPFLAGLLGLFAFWRLCRTMLTPGVAGIAVAILAVSYYPVRHSAEVKPYVFDLLAAIIYAWLALEHVRDQGSWRWLAALVVFAPLAVFTSYPSVFVGGAVSLVLLPGMRSACWVQRGLFALFNVALCSAFLFNVTMIGKPETEIDSAETTRQFLHDYWKDAFPPEDLVQWPVWLVKVMSGNMLAYPLGANHGGSTATLLLVLLGSIALWRGAFTPPPPGEKGEEGAPVKPRGRAILALCWLPFLLNLIAACFHKYPFGESARITLHLAPFICILMAHGLCQLLAWIPSSAWQSRGQVAVYALLLVCGIVGLVRDVRKPYKTEHDREVRQLAIDISQQAGEEPVWLCHADERELIAEFQWHMRIRSRRLEWLTPESAIPSTTQAGWLVRCGPSEPTLAYVVERAGPGWRVAEQGVRAVPPENAKMPTMHCRWVRIVRE